jgi:hypothetical protein
MTDKALNYRAGIARGCLRARCFAAQLLFGALAIGSAAGETDSTAVEPAFLGALDEFDSLRLFQSKVTGKERLILGDIHGFVHVYEKRDGSYQEIWISEYFEGPVSGIFVTDINNDDLEEFVVYTEDGRFHFLDIEDYSTIWSNPPNEYEHISAMYVYNVDDDPQDELLFIADGRLIIFDGQDQFEEWRSDEETLQATYILVGDVDGDGADEIILNDGYIYDARYHDLEWQSSQSFGQRMGLLDVDGDGILEVVGEFGDRFLRIFDIDLRRMKSPRR